MQGAIRLFWVGLASSAESGFRHGRMARGGHELHKVLPGSALPYPSTPCGRATPEMAFRDGPPLRPAACSRLQPLWTPHALRQDQDLFQKSNLLSIIFVLRKKFVR
jgi:hypothetical protein